MKEKKSVKGRKPKRVMRTVNRGGDIASQTAGQRAQGERGSISAEVKADAQGLRKSSRSM